MLSLYDIDQLFARPLVRGGRGHPTRTDYTESDARADERALKDHVKANLARYKVPREIVFLDRLPRNPTGKVLKRELPTGD